jgi:hypothetical protein
MTCFVDTFEALAIRSFFVETGALSEAVATDAGNLVRRGVSGVWVLCNASYAGMRAQGSPSSGWRALAFFFGLPGTLVSFFAVVDGSNRAYGVFLPPRPRKA